MQDGVAEKQRGPENNGDRQVRGHIGFITLSRRLIAGHADKDGNNADWIHQREQANKEFDIA